ncbi:MAG: hypothetical protein EBT06_07645 [Gammaproteobacteria bacterium]|nr:hypothetical protein [Gammaproteobacteria bacterium]NBT44782.1 hypothetical protein [Gammaproteobacteria bacterium]NDE56267.1 hypothetical protein [Gammaproteobacteria bacterium]
MGARCCNYFGKPRWLTSDRFYVHNLFISSEEIIRGSRLIHSDGIVAPTLSLALKDPHPLKQRCTLITLFTEGSWGS